MARATTDIVDAWLRMWAGWLARADNGYPGACPLGRARDATRSSVPASRIPAGVETAMPVAAVIRALALGDERHGECMAALRLRYMSPAAGHDEIAEALGISPRTLSERLRAGKMFLAGYFALLEAAAQESAVA